MLSPNAMKNIRTGLVISSVPDTWKSPTRPVRCPSWKTNASSPTVAARFSVLRNIAFSGRSTLPVNRNSRMKVAVITTAKAGSRLRLMECEVSRKCGASPPMRTPNGAGVACSLRTRSFAGSDSGDLSVCHTDSQAPRCVPTYLIGVFGTAPTRSPRRKLPVTVSMRATPGSADSRVA